MAQRKRFTAAAGLVCLFALGAPRMCAYAVLTHEAIIDSAWDQSIQPLLLKRFPGATPEDLRKAHAFAYGGCIIQDMGYYPFGSKFFSSLLHYVRSGDFVMTMLADAQDLDEYAFAVGALAHYAADNLGHPLAVNRSVPLLYPKLRAKYGPAVTYEEDPAAHLKTEFGFDVLEVAHGNYAPQSYHDFIGFQVSRPVLERAFRETYSLELKDVFSDLDLALGTYRRTVSRIIPQMTRVAWSLKKSELVRARPGLTRRRFIYNLSRASYVKEWDRKWEQPGIGARVLAFLFRLIPKVGPLKALALKPPTAETERLFMDSFNRTLDLDRQLLAEAGRGRPRLPNRDFDTGRPTRPREYGLADQTYAKLTRELGQRDPATINAKLREDILDFYKVPKPPAVGKKRLREWEDTMAALARIQDGQAEQ